MLSLYNNRLNGILADEMGLGKTVQVMSFRRGMWMVCMCARCACIVLCNFFIWLLATCINFSILLVILLTCWPFAERTTVA